MDSKDNPNDKDHQTQSDYFRSIGLGHLFRKREEDELDEVPPHKLKKIIKIARKTRYNSWYYMLKRDKDLENAIITFYNAKRDNDFHKLLKKYTNNNNIFDIKKYSMQYDMKIENIHGNFFSQKYFGSIFNLCIMYENKMVSSIGFNLKYKYAYVNRIQGIKGQEKYLKDIEWGKSLVNYLEEWCLQTQIPEIIIESVFNNLSARKTFYSIKLFEGYPNGTTFSDAVKMNPKDEKKYADIAHKNFRKNHGKNEIFYVHLFPSRGIMYDIIAKSMGYERNKQGNFSKKFID